MLLRQLALSLAHRLELGSSAEPAAGAEPAQQRLEPLLEEAAAGANANRYAPCMLLSVLNFQISCSVASLAVMPHRPNTRQLGLVVMSYASVLLQPLLAHETASVLLHSNRHQYTSAISALADQESQVCGCEMKCSAPGQAMGLVV